MCYLVCVKGVWAATRLKQALLHWQLDILCIFLPLVSIYVPFASPFADTKRWTFNIGFTKLRIRVFGTKLPQKECSVTVPVISNTNLTMSGVGEIVIGWYIHVGHSLTFHPGKCPYTELLLIASLIQVIQSATGSPGLPELKIKCLDSLLILSRKDYIPRRRTFSISHVNK